MADVDETILSKWLEGKLKKEEVDKLSKEHDLPYLESILDRQAQLNIPTTSSAVLWENFTSLKRIDQSDLATHDVKTRDKSRSKFIIFSVFLIMVLALAFMYLYNANGTVTIKAKKGEALEYAMLDGSKIHISPLSAITFDSANWLSDRKIRLKGQAYFEVEAGSPFSVHTEAGIVTVLGTSFDIWSIDPTNLSVFCTEGKVSVENVFGNHKIIQEGEGVQINNNDLSDILPMDSNRQYWLNGQKTYRSSKIDWILKDFERFYDVKISIAPLLKEKQFSGVIPTQDLDKAIIYLTKTMGWDYEIRDKNITITVN